jgi:ankyrin repeat protein
MKTNQLQKQRAIPNFVWAWRRMLAINMTLANLFSLGVPPLLASPAEETVTLTEFGQKTTYTRLGAAILKRDVKAVNKFLEEGADVEHPVSDEQTALQMAAEHGYLEIVKSLLEKGADPNGTAGSEIPPILKAFSDFNNNGPDTISLLLEKGAKVNVVGKAPFGVELEPPIVRAPKLGMKVVEMLVAHGADIHAQVSQFDEVKNMVTESLYYSSAECLRFALENNVEIPSNCHGSDGFSGPILSAVLSNRRAYGSPEAKEATLLEFIKWVRTKGLEKEYLEVKTNGWTPLMVACRAEMSEVAKALINAGVNVDAATENGWTALHSAANLGLHEVIKMIAARGKRSVDATNSKGRTALHLAVEYKNYNAVRTLLELAADPEIKDSTGVSPFSLAEQTNQSGIVKLFQKARGEKKQGEPTSSVASTPNPGPVSTPVSPPSDTHPQQKQPAVLKRQNTRTSAAESKKIPFADLETTVLQSQGLTINNINLVTERALLGGTKATFQCSGKNKSKSDLNYTVYLSAFDKDGNLLACFGVEPTLNIHAAGKIENLEASGMVSSETKDHIDYVLLKLVVQQDPE